MVSGKTASIPEGSTDAEPDGIRIRIVGGESSKTSIGQYIENICISCRLKTSPSCYSDDIKLVKVYLKTKGG